MKYLRGQNRTDSKRPDAVSVFPREMGKQLVWAAMVVVAFAPNLLNQDSLSNLGTTAIDAESRKIYQGSIDNGYMFQPVTLEKRGSLAKILKHSLGYPVKCSVVCTMISELVVFQGTSMALQNDNAACVPGTVKDRDAFEELYLKSIVCLG